MVWPTPWNGLSFHVTERDCERGTAQATVDGSEAGACLQLEKRPRLWGRSCGWVRLQELGAGLSGKVSCVEQVTGTHRSGHYPRDEPEKRKENLEDERGGMRSCVRGILQWMSMGGLPRAATDAHSMDPISKGPHIAAKSKLNIFIFLAATQTTFRFCVNCSRTPIVFLEFK